MPTVKSPAAVNTINERPITDKPRYLIDLPVTTFLWRPKETVERDHYLGVGTTFASGCVRIGPRLPPMRREARRDALCPCESTDEQCKRRPRRHRASSYGWSPSIFWVLSEPVRRKGRYAAPPKGSSGS